MTRLPQVTDQQAAPAAAELFGALKSKLGFVPNLYRVAGSSPSTLAALLGLGEALGKGSFDAKTREAIALAVAGANSCDYCASAHTAISKSLKIEDAEIVSRLHGKSADKRIGAIIAFAVTLVQKRGFATDADLAAARQAGLSDADIVETIGVTVQNIFTNYINHVAQTDIDFPVVKTAA
jgi:uncharacterized peroxidase-related enzyme